jgi:beta-barrel assembly-enhancing protease
MRLRVVVFSLLVFAGSALSQTLNTALENVQPLPDPVRTAPAGRVFHDHSIRDIDAIGNRNIGCGRGFGNWYSLEKQIAMGKGLSSQIESTSRMITDPEVTEYINRVGQNLVRNSDSLVPFTIQVVDSEDINAFALPGGFFYVDSGLILSADSEAELAGVMAHEIAHVAACHVARQNTRGQLMNMASIPLMVIGGPIGYAGYEALSVAGPLTFLKFSRGFEAEADFLGVQYMYKAGYDPQAFASFFEKVKELEKHKQNRVAKAFETHPPTPDRIEKTQKEISTLLPAEVEYKVDTSEFQDVKARLDQLENRQRNKQEKGRPTLRRRSSSTDDSAPANDDQHPTLKQRPQ